MTSLTLPFPPSSLSPNRARSLHWAAKGKIAARYREDCGWAARAAWGTRKPLSPPVSIAVTFVVADKRRRDMDNLIAAFKPGLDGLVDAGVIEADHWQGLSITYSVEQGFVSDVRVGFPDVRQEGRVWRLWWRCMEGHFRYQVIDLEKGT